MSTLTCFPLPPIKPKFLFYILTLFHPIISPTSRLAHCRVTREWIEHLAFGLKFPYLPLRELDLSNNDLTDLGVMELCNALKYPTCRLNILRYSMQWPYLCCHFTFHVDLDCCSISIFIFHFYTKHQSFLWSYLYQNIGI